MKIHRRINDNTWYTQDADDYFSSYGSPLLDKIMGACLLFFIGMVVYSILIYYNII